MGAIRMLRRAVAPMQDSFDGLRSRVDALADHVRRLTAETETLAAQIRSLDASRDALAQSVAELHDRLAIESVRHWIRHAPLTSQPLISVILPVHARAGYVERAIESVRGQRYQNWEVLVIGDGDPRHARMAVAQSQDPRVRYCPVPKAGVGPARNAGLRLATGALITYLDDDNFMDPEWLYAVVWAFEQRPEVEVLYGACAVDNPSRLDPPEPGELPAIFLTPFSREALTQNNPADIGSIAHRAGLSGAWFDESMPQMADWDLMVRLTAAGDPLVLPMVSHYYRTDAPNRLSHGPTFERDRATVMARAARGPS